MAKCEENYNAWLAKQAAMGRKLGPTVSVSGAQYPTVVNRKTDDRPYNEGHANAYAAAFSELLGDE